MLPPPLNLRRHQTMNRSTWGSAPACRLTLRSGNAAFCAEFKAQIPVTAEKRIHPPPACLE